MFCLQSCKKTKKIFYFIFNTMMDFCLENSVYNFKNMFLLKQLRDGSIRNGVYIGEIFFFSFSFHI